MITKFKARVSLIFNLIAFGVVMLISQLIMHNVLLSIFIGTIYLSVSELVMFLHMGSIASQFEPQFEASYIYATISKDGETSHSFFRFLDMKAFLDKINNDGYRIDKYEVYNYLWKVDSEDEQGKKDIEHLVTEVMK